VIAHLHKPENRERDRRLAAADEQCFGAALEIRDALLDRIIRWVGDARVR